MYRSIILTVNQFGLKRWALMMDRDRYSKVLNCRPPLSRIKRANPSYSWWCPPWSTGSDLTQHNKKETVPSPLLQPKYPTALFYFFLANTLHGKALLKLLTSLVHLHVWGCPVKATIYNPQERKLDPKTINGVLFDILKSSKDLDFTILLITQKL